VTREARYAVVVGGTTNRQQQPAEFRLAPGLQLGVIDQETEPALVEIGENKIYDTSLGANVEIPIKITRRGDFKDPVKLVAVGLTQQMKPKDVTLDASKKESKFELALNQQNLKPGTYTFYLKGETKHKYARNPAAIAAEEAEQKRLAEKIKQLDAEVKKATAAKDDASLKAAQEKLKAANQMKAQVDKRLADAKKANQPKDVPLALISTPVKLRIHATPIKIDSAKLAAPLQPGEKQPLTVEFERLYGVAGDVEVLFEPPAGAKGLPAQKTSVPKDKSAAALDIAAAADASAGEHACTVRLRGKFNNVQVEATAPLTVTIKPK
jgi:hypothetical protein